MVNDFTGGSFMETHYHSQFDNDEYYDPQVYQFHHELYALLILAIDATAVVPLSFTGVMKRAQEGLELSLIHIFPKFICKRRSSPNSPVSIRLRSSL